MFQKPTKALMKMNAGAGVGSQAFRMDSDTGVGPVGIFTAIGGSQRDRACTVCGQMLWWHLKGGDLSLSGQQ